MPRLWCDMDGVLADFDSGWSIVMGRPINRPRDYHIEWTQKDWDTLYQTAPNFFRDLPPMPDAHILWKYIAPHCPTILTGIPREVHHSANQKVEWAAAQPFLGPTVPVQCCRSKEKWHYCRPGDVIIDDWEKYRHLWEQAGGIWITHTSAESSIEQLKEMGL